jgi:hypothetical protein
MAEITSFKAALARAGIDISAQRYTALLFFRGSW